MRYSLNDGDFFVDGHEDTVDDDDQHDEEGEDGMRQNVNCASTNRVERCEQEHCFSRTKAEDILVLGNDHKRLKEKQQSNDRICTRNVILTYFSFYILVLSLWGGGHLTEHSIDDTFFVFL